MLKITKAVITAAGRGGRLFPAADTLHKAMLPFADRDGFTKPLIQIIAEEALTAGVEELCIVCAPGDQQRYRDQFKALKNNLALVNKGSDRARSEAKNIDNLMDRLQFAEQKEPLGYGHAVHCSHSFVNDQPFILLLGDHLYISRDRARNCARQLMEIAEKEGTPVSSVNPVREHLIRHYGTITGRRLSKQKGVYQIEKIIEKPSISSAELELQTPGLRAGFYLCFFGMHILTPRVFEMLQENFENVSRTDRYGLTPALNAMASSEKYLALEIQGSRYDISAKLGVLRAQIALSLAGSERDILLSTVAEMLAEDSQTGTAEGKE